MRPANLPSLATRSGTAQSHGSHGTVLPKPTSLREVRSEKELARSHYSSPLKSAGPPLGTWQTGRSCLWRGFSFERISQTSTRILTHISGQSPAEAPTHSIFWL